MISAILTAIDQEQCTVAKISSEPKDQTYNRKLRSVMQWTLLYTVLTIYILGCQNLTPWPYIPAYYIIKLQFLQYETNLHTLTF